MRRRSKILIGSPPFCLFLALVTVIKLVLMGSFTSDYESQMFIPFVQEFLAGGGREIYHQFYLEHGFVAFPYPPLMLFIEAAGGLGASLLGKTPFLYHMLFKMPLLAFDFLGLYFLMRIYANKRRYVGLLYFASPVILYACYMHGQLDIIPTSLFIGSLYFLTSHSKYAGFSFSLLLAASLLTKLHILAAVPLVFIYLLKKDEHLKIGMASGIVLLLGVLCILPFSNMTFWQSVLFNKEQSLMTQVYLQFVNLRLYIPVLALMFIYIQEYMLRDMNRGLFISFCGLLFGVFLICLPPMPGWYVWIVPFLTGLFIEVSDSKYRNLTIYATFHAVYLLFFLTAHPSNYVDLYLGSFSLGFLKVNNSEYANVVFTVLEGLLVYLIYALYQQGISSNLFYKRKQNAFAIGIAGDSGAGKSTLLAIIQRCFGKRNVLLIEGDGDHKWERGAEEWHYYTQLNPKGNYLYRQARDIAMLKRGTAVYRVEYDHDTGKFTQKHRVAPNKYILLSGLHAFYLPQMRHVLDMKIYMDTDENLRRFWKIQRDTRQRGYSQAKVIQQIESRIEDTQKYIVPQKKYADLIIHYFDDTLESYLSETHQVCLSLRFTFSAAVNVEPVVESLRRYGIQVEYEFSDDLNNQVVTVPGQLLDQKIVDFQDVMNRVIPHLDELSPSSFADMDTREGIIQLMVLLLVSYKMRVEQ